MSDILHYIAEHPFFSLILLGIIVLAFGLAPFSSSSTENKRSAIINKHYNDTFLLLYFSCFHLPQGHVYLFLIHLFE